MTATFPDPNRTPGFSEADVATLIDRFYDKVRLDPLIGPVFNAVVKDWATHKSLLTSFWCSVALRAGSYRGNPMAKHQPLPVKREHFARWLELWRATVPEIMDADSSDLMINYAERIGAGLRMGMGLGDRPRGRDLGVPMYAPRPAAGND